MDIQQTTKIDLAEFGMVGEMVIGNPTLRKTIEMKNALGNCTKTHLVDGKPVIDETRLGDVDVIIMLSYVRTAPFKVDLNGFLSYCDLMDSRNVGSAQKLFDKMTEIINEYKDGAKSPFVNSQDAVTENSASENSITP